MCDPGCLYGTYRIGRYLCRLGTDSLCRCDVLRCCVHPADHRTERYEPDCGFSDLKSGILHLGTGRLDPSEPEAFRTGVIRMCADVCSDHSGTASLREKSIKSRDIQVKMPSPKVIRNAFWLVTVRVLNSYKYPSYAPCTYFLADVFQDSFMDSNRSISRSSSAWE